MNPTSMVVHIEWTPRSGLLFTAETVSGVPIAPTELALLLFAFDTQSFYGTRVQTDMLDHREGIFLSAQAALDYFTNTYANEQVTIMWPAAIKAMRATAARIRNALTTAAYAPDYESWRAGAWQWVLTDTTPDQTDAEVAIELPYLQAWVDAAIKQTIAAVPEVKTAWAEVLRAAPLLNPSRPNRQTPVPLDPAHVWLDATDWKQAIGLAEDDTPFTVALQCCDPFVQPTASPHLVTAAEDWTLRVLLQDKTDVDFIVPYAASPAQPSSENTAGGASVEGADATSQPPARPEAWVPYLDRVEKRITQWTALVPWLQAVSTQGEPTLKWQLNPDEAWKFLEEASVRISEQGTPVFLPLWWEQIQHEQLTMKAKVRSSVGATRTSQFGLSQTLSFDWRIAIGDLDLSEAEFAQLVAQKRRLVYFQGHWVRVNPELFKRMATKMKKLKENRGLSLRDVFELHLQSGEQNATHEGLAKDLLGDDAARVQMEVNLDATLTELMRKLHQTAEIPAVVLPNTFHGQLRPYQQVGVSWLAFLQAYGLGACLADDMGLGKTVQYIAYLLHTRAAAENETAAAIAAGPSIAATATAKAAATATTTATATVMPTGLPVSLLICPTSVIGNWQKELERFAPDLRVYIHYGAKRLHGTAFVAACRTVDLVITSYTLAHLDETDVASVHFASLCLDEAQNIKNAHTKQAMAIRKLQAHHRIAMTGTPIENRLTELWSIFDFLNPGLLGSLRRFQERFVNPIERSQDATRILQVQRLVKPFLLRRLKLDPAIQLDLPEKVEEKVYVSLTPEQAALYEGTLTEMLAKLDELVGIERSGIILTTLMKLKQICNHPANFLKTGKVTGGKGQSNKLTRLLELVSEVREAGDQCLVFTQFVEMGQLLRQAFEQHLKETVLFLHGGLTKTQRDTVVDAFQAGQAGVFILSLRAGGVGLNLTAASHVFHFDRWWNPAVENQATDRAFRIGQTKQVQVHKFVTLGTLEERIDEIIDQKQALSEQIVGSGESWITQMSTTQLRELFALRREWVEQEV